MLRDKLFLIIVLAALLVRFLGCWYGLPALYNSDEPFNVVNALAYGAKQSLEPTYHVYPALHSYLLLIVYGIYFIAGRMVGVFDSTIDFGASYFLDPTGLFWAGRLLSVFLGVATVFVLFALARRFFSKRVAYLAAGLLSLSFTHADLSHWVLPEAAVGFMTLFALYWIFRCNETTSAKSILIAGLLSGAAISTKYNAGFIVLPLLLATGWNDKGANRLKRLALGLVALCAGFLMTSPYWVVSFASYWRDLSYTFAHVRTGMPGHIAALPFVWPLWQLVVSDWGIGLLFVAGFFSVFFQRDRQKILIAALVVPTILFVGLWTRSGVHYLAPILPAMALLAGLFMDQVLTRRLPTSTRVLILIAIFFPAFLKIGHYDFRLTQKDSRTTAKEWIEKNIPARSTIAYENYVYGPNLFDPGRYLNESDESTLLPLRIREILVEESLRRVSYHMVNLRKAFKPRVLMNSPDLQSGGNAYVRQLLETRLPKISTVADAGVSYLLISSNNYDRYFESTPPRRGTPLWVTYQNGRRFYGNVMHGEQTRLMKSFNSNFWNLGPAIRIYQFKQPAENNDG